MKKLLFAVFVLSSVAAARPARAADTNFDLSVQTGVGYRFLGSPSGGGGGNLPGSWDPMLIVEADVALVPLLRVGLYVDEEIAIDGEPRAPFMTGFGGRFKFTPAGLNTDKFRLWVFAGVGFTGVVAPGYSENLPFQAGGSNNTAPQQANVQSVNGYFLEIPFGIGGSYKLHGNWSFVSELSGRAALDSSGEYFDPLGRTTTATGTNGTNQAAAGVVIGTESVGIFLTAGIGLDL